MSSENIGPFKEDETIKLPQFNEGVIAIGDLFDCVSAKSAGYNLFGQKLTNDHLVAHPQRDFEYTLKYIKNTQDKINTMFIDASVSLELLSGKMKIEGSILYDSKDNNNFNDDQLDFNMRLDSFVVQALPAAKTVIDPFVKDLLSGNGSIKATHVCTQIYVGAEAVGTLKVNETGKLDWFRLEGSLSGSIEAGGMTASASVELEFMDTKKTENVTKNVSIKSKPPTVNQPTNIDEMFKAINAIPVQIEKERHFQMITTQNVVGVPMRYILVPINQFLPDLAIRRTYKTMSQDLERAFQEMMFVLVDFQIEGHFKTLVLHGDKKLLDILQDSANPLTNEIMDEEKALREIAKRLHSRASQLFQDYKEGELGENGEKALQDFIEVYNEEFKIHEVYNHVEMYVENGRKQLSGIHSSDLNEETSHIKIFTNKKDLEEWQSQERKIKVLLNTNTKEETTKRTPGGVFLTLYKLSPFLKNFDIDVAVAYPNVSKNFSLAIKAKHLEYEYTHSDVEFALEVLSVAVGHAQIVPSTFYTVLASLSGIKLPLKDNLEDINPLIATLKETKNIKICPSYLTMKEIIGTPLMQKDNKWKFVVEADASESVADNVHFFRRFYSSMSPLLKSQSDWIVGTFGLTGFPDAPMLFVFRNGEIRAICFDNLDLLILQEQLEGSTNAPDLDLLSPEKITWRGLYPGRLDFALNVLEQMGQHHKTLAKDTGAMESFGLEKEPVTNLDNSIRVTKAALTGKPIDFISALAFVCLQSFSDLLPFLKKSGWSEVSSSFPASMKVIDWVPVAKDSKEFFQKRNPFLTIVEYTTKKLSELLELVGTEIPDEDGPKAAKKLEGKSKDTKFPPIPKTIEEQIMVTIDAVFFHEDCPIELQIQIKEYYKCDAIDLRVNGITYVLEAFMEEKFSEPENAYLRAMINLAEKLSLEGESPDQTIMDIIGLIVRGTNHICNSTLEIPCTSTPIQKYIGASKALDDYLKRQNLYETLSLLSKCKWNPKLYLVHHKLFFLNHLYDIDAMVELIIDMASFENPEFTPDDYYDLWQNPKFVHFYTNGLYVDRIIDCLKVYQCKLDERSDEIIVSEFLPLEFQDKIRQLIIQDKKFGYVWEKEWADDHNLFLAVLQSINIRGFLPADFNAILQQNVVEHENLKDFMKEVGVLYFWNEKERLFTQPWDIFAIQKATNKIQRWIAKENLGEIKPVQIEIQHESQDFTDPIKNIDFIDSWGPVTNDLIFKLDSKKYEEMTQLTDKLEKDDVRQLKNTMSRILPYLHENLKMSNPTVLDRNPVFSYIPYPSPDDWKKPGKIDFESEDENTSFVPFVSRADLLNCLISTSDSSVSAKILSRFSHTKLALPLMIPEITKSENIGIRSRMLLPYLKNLPIQWKTTGSSTPQKHYLFSDPNRLIVAIRMGENVPGKSFLLNNVLKDGVLTDRSKGTFSSAMDIGMEKGRPISLEGLVEFIWLNEDNCGNKLWKLLKEKHYDSGKNEALLLANVHGDIFNHFDILRELYKITSCFFVFVMPDSQENLKEKVEELSEIVNKSDLYYMLVKEDFLQTPLNETLSEIVDIFGTILDHVPKPWSLDQLEINHPVFMPQDVQLPESQKLIQKIQIDTCPKIRDVMQLQKLPQYKRDEFNETWIGNAVLQNIITMFASILTLPTRLRNAAMTHVQQEIRILSFASTAKNRKQISELTNELQETLMSAKPDIILNIQNQLKESKRLLADRSLGLEHFFREIGRVYEATDANMHLNYKILNSYAEYINSGNEIEIFSQELDSGDIMWGRWLKETITRSDLFKNYRVFVVSVLGMNSSGKSTMLNTLFGSNFDVHEVACTRGLHMRMVFLNEALVRELKYDIILVIDSEGLGDSRTFVKNGEEMKPGYKQRYDLESETKLRRLAAFVLGISDLTLLCVRGNSMHEMKPILEIAFTKLMMVDSSYGENGENIALPDVLIVQHPEDSLSGENTENSDKIVFNELKQAVLGACDLTEKYEMYSGVRIRCGRKLEKIMQRIRVNNVQRVFKSFYLEGSQPTDGQGPSYGYYQSAADLYTEILDICKASTEQGNPRNFLDWYADTETFWRNNICSTVFPLDFIDIESVNDYCIDQLSIGEIKDAVELAFKSHQSEIQEKMEDLFKFEKDSYDEKIIPNEEDPDQTRESLRHEKLNWLKNRLHQITATCKLQPIIDGKHVEVPCRPCQKALKLKEAIYKGKTITVLDLEKINQYIVLIRENIWNHWTQSLMTQEMLHEKSKEFDDILITVNLGECWNPRNPCAQTDLKRIIALKTTVIGPARQIEMEASEAYPNLPHIYQQLESSQALPDLGTIKAFDLGYYNALKNVDVDEVDGCERKSEYINWSQQDWLQEKIKDLPELMRKVHQADLYEIGFIRELQRRVQVDVLDAFEKKENEKLLPDFKWQCHLYAIRIFSEQMEDLQKVWDANNQPLLVLPDIMEYYKPKPPPSLIDPRFN